MCYTSFIKLTFRKDGERTMSLSKTRSIDIPLTMDSFETANQFIEQWLAQNRFSKDNIIETKLLFEALFHDIIEQGFDQDTTLTIKAQRTFGEYNIKFGFEGKSYVPVEKNKDKVKASQKRYWEKKYKEIIKEA